MLVLRRRTNESILIGAGIKVTILAIEKGIVKIGVDAPDSVAILREELLEENEHEESNITYDR